MSTAREKQFLRQIRKLDSMIANKRTEIGQLKELASGGGPPFREERVMSSGHPGRMGELITAYVDLERELCRDLEELIRAKREIIAVIERLDGVEYDLLHRLYVQGQTFQAVADRYDRTYSWATTVHGRALKHVRALLEAEDAVRTEKAEDAEV